MAVSISKLLHEILGHDHIQWHPQLVRHYTNLHVEPYNRTGPYNGIRPYYPISGGFRRTLQRVWLANRGQFLFSTPGLVSCGICICFNVETIFPRTCHVSELHILNIPRHLSFASTSFTRIASEKRYDLLRLDQLKHLIVRKLACSFHFAHLP